MLHNVVLMSPQNSLAEHQAELCKILANPKRIQIIQLLKDNELAVSKIAEQLELNQSNVSQHLSLMRAQGVVNARREGQEIIYSIAVPEITEACELMKIALKKIRETTSTT